MEIRVKTPSRTFAVRLTAEATVKEVRSSLTKAGVQDRSYALIYKQRPLQDGEQLSTVGVTSNSVLLLMSHYEEIQYVSFTLRYHQITIPVTKPAELTFEKLKRAISVRVGLYPEQIRLLHNGLIVDDRTVLSELCPGNSPESTVIDVQSVDHFEFPDGFLIYVKSVVGVKYELRVTKSTTIEQVKKMLSEHDCIFWDEYRLVFAGKCVFEPNVVGDYNIEPNSCLHVVFRVRYRTNRED